MRLDVCPDMSIYFEQQESGFCAVHCVNNLLQGAYFSAISLSEIALAIDAEEKALLGAEEARAGDGRFAARGGSENVNLDGYFSIQVIRKALAVWDLEAVNLDAESASDARANPGGQVAFVAHLHDHWFALRKIAGQWWNLNSLQEGGPERISDFYFQAYVDSLRAKRWTIFVIRGGAFPQPNMQLEGRGRWMTPRQIDAARAAAAKAPRPPQQGHRASESEEIARAIALSLGDGSSPAAAVRVADEEEEDDEDDDAAIARAIALSLDQR